MNMVRYSQLDFHATSPLISSPLCTFSLQGASFVSCASADFFVHLLSCLFSLCAGINRRVVCGMRVPHGEGLALHAGLESCAAVGAMTAVAVSDLAYIDTLS